MDERRLRDLIKRRKKRTKRKNIFISGSKFLKGDNLTAANSQVQNFCQNRSKGDKNWCEMLRQNMHNIHRGQMSDWILFERLRRYVI